jgi:hypothetical protein
MQLIQTVTVGSGGAAAIEFNSIAATFTDLKLVVSVRSAGATQNMGIKINGSTANFSSRALFGDGSTATSSTSFPNWIGVSSGTNQTANTFSSHEVYFPNYTSSNNKSFSIDAVNETNGTEAYQTITASLWSQTAAISSLEVYQLQSANLAQFSSASLYGITAGSSGGVVVS